MGDEKQYTVQIKGTAYKFRPITKEGFTLLMLVMNMGASQTKILKALTKVLGESAGPDQWDAITDRLIAGEVDIEDVSTSLLKTIIKRQSKAGAQTEADSAPADDAQ